MGRCLCVLSMLSGMVLVALTVLKLGHGVLESELFLFELNASATHCELLCNNYFKLRYLYVRTVCTL